jgi:histidine triad (HIT) family protein
MAGECLFCEMAAGRMAVDKLYDQNGVFAIRDINPRAPKHVLVIPQRHIPKVSDLTAADGDLLSAMFSAANEVAKTEGLAESGYRCTFNVGDDGGQTVFHIHMHVLGGRKLGPEG